MDMENKMMISDRDSLMVKDGFIESAVDKIWKESICFMSDCSGGESDVVGWLG